MGDEPLLVIWLLHDGLALLLPVHHQSKLIHSSPKWVVTDSKQKSIIHTVMLHMVCTHTHRDLKIVWFLWLIYLRFLAEIKQNSPCPHVPPVLTKYVTTIGNRTWLAETCTIWQVIVLWNTPFIGDLPLPLYPPVIKHGDRCWFSHGYFPFLTFSILGDVPKNPY